MSARFGTTGLIVSIQAIASWNCGRSDIINERAALSGNLPANPLQWQVITSSVDRPASTMSILYGNDVAVRYARQNPGQEYPPGSVLSLVTWAQQEDIHWFGANIPGQVKSVEFVTVTPAAASYERYEGSPLVRTPAANRAAYLLSLRAAVMP